MLLPVLVAGDANASTTAIQIEPGKSTAFFYGTWDTSSLTFEFSPDNGTTWFPVVAAKTANATFDFTAYSDLDYRATLASVGAGTSVNLWVVQNAFPFNT